MGRRKELYWLACSDLREQYVDNRMSMQAIGDEYGIGAELVKRRLKECGLYEIEDYAWIKCSNLRNMYVDGQMSMDAIAGVLEVPTSVISRQMGECGIKKRSVAEQAKLVKQTNYYDPAVLKWLYRDMGFSTTQIRIAFGVVQSTVVRWLRENDIEARPVGDSLRHVSKHTPKPIRSINDYLMVRHPDHPRADSWGYVKLHRLAYERHYGKIPEGYVVHAIDGNHDNVAKGNLRAMTNSEHSKFHCYANLKATGYAFKPCPKDQLARYMAEWDEMEEEKNEFID